MLRNFIEKTTIKGLKIASIVLGIAVVGVASELVYQRRKFVKQMPFYVKSMKLVKDNKHFDLLVGLPYKIGAISLFNENNCFYQNRAMIELPVYGSRIKGTLFLEGVYSEQTKSVILEKLSFQAENEDDRYVLFKLDASPKEVHSS